MPFEWYIRIPFGLALGAALAFGLVLPTSAGPQHAVRLPFRILAALGLMGLRMMMLPTCTILEAALWGVFGLLLAPSLNAPMPLRWRAVQAYYRPTFLALALAMMAAGLTRWVFYQTDTIFYSYYGVLGSLRFIDTLAYIIWIAAALTGAFLAMRMMKPMGYSGQPPFSPRVFWTLLTATSLIVLLAYFIVRLPFERVPYSSWIVLILSAGMAGGIAVFSLRRKQAAQHWLLKTVQTMGRTSGKLALQTKSGSLTQKATSLPERAARRLQSLLGPAPLDGLTPVTAATAATISTLVITMLAITVWSFFALFISLLGFLIVAAVLAWIGYMVWKANRK